MGTVNLKTASGGSVILSPANTASDVTITVPAISAPMAINGPCFSAYQSVSVTLSNTTFTKIPFQTKVFDTSSAFDNITNYRFQPLVAGYYQCTAGYSISIATGVTLIGIFKSNVRTSDASYVANPGGATVNFGFVGKR